MNVETLYVDLDIMDRDKSLANLTIRNQRGVTVHESGEISLDGIKDLIKNAEQYFYTDLPELVTVGKQLFDWLSGGKKDRLNHVFEKYIGLMLVLAIKVCKELSYLPWEALHDGDKFLVEKISPKIIPLRYVDKYVPQPSNNKKILDVLFMAASPEKIFPVLNFEAEEMAILDATRLSHAPVPFTLHIEESGCVDGLQELWRTSKRYFQIFHLTGHATIINQNNQMIPIFYTELFDGKCKNSTANDLFNALFNPHLPRLVFLSGCRTGENPTRHLKIATSMAEELVTLGIPTVLGWGQPVNDCYATKAAAEFYKNLAQGLTIAAALSETYISIMGNPAWSSLRLYALNKSWNNALIQKGGNTPPTHPNREPFVGRRRVLQRCFDALQQNSGVLLYGLKGVGKTSVANRLVSRKRKFYEVVIKISGQFSKDRLNEELRKICNTKGETYRANN